jgi:hypothetical protein
MHVEGERSRYGDTHDHDGFAVPGDGNDIIDGSSCPAATGTLYVAQRGGWRWRVRAGYRVQYG